MNNTQKLTGGIIIAVVVVGVLWWAFNQKQVPTLDKPLKIGAVLALSGDLAVIGEEIQKGIKMAQKEAEAEGMLIEVVYEDGQSLNAASAVSGAKKLLEIDDIDAGLTGLIQEAKPITSLFAAQQIPLVVTWDSDAFVENAGDYLFSTGFSTEKAGQKMAMYAYEELGARRIAVINQLDPWSETISTAFAVKFKTLGGNIVIQEAYQPSEKDYRTFITKAKDANVDAIYLPLIPGTCADFLTQAKRLSVDTALLSGDSLLQDEIDAAGDAAEGVYFTNFFTDEIKAIKITKSYHSMFGSDPIDTTLVSFGYDGFKAIQEAVEDAGSGNIQKGLIKIIGPSRTLDRTENIYQVKNGKQTFIK
ncbi:MAG TPA: penicillin-binding protein activator [Candidatus Andersenbacteria bacterium]|nr:penicillin-binding protein activator [Candidatus Andersenbacteria bacterium]